MNHHLGRVNFSGSAGRNMFTIYSIDTQQSGDAEMIYTGPKTLEEARQLDEIKANNAAVSRMAPVDRVQF